MMIYRRLTMILVFIIFLFMGCFVQKKSFESAYDSEEYFEYFETNELFEIKVLSHERGCNCGVIACASVTVGITKENDTLRVLMLCDTNNYEQNMYLKIQPQKKPSYEVSVPTMWVEGGNEVKVSEFCRRKLKTTYGVVVP